MKRALVVLLLLIANALVNSEKTGLPCEVAQASSLNHPESGKLEACATL